MQKDASHIQKIDTIIHARWIIPVEPDNTLLEHHALVIQNGHIHDLLPSTDAENSYEADHIYQLDQTHVLIPGFVNAHTHSPMSLLRGYGDDMPLMDWLQNRIWPAEAKWVNEAFVKDGVELAMAEMLRSGTTCFADMYFFPNIIAKAAQAANMRCSLGLIVLDFPTVWASNADEYINKGIALHDQYKDHSLISTMFAPHAPYTVSDEPFQKLQTLANELDIPVQCHVHETEFEVADAVEKTAMRPLQRLNKLELLSPALMAVHMTQLADDEIDLLAECNVNVVHCPESNLKLASGYCPVEKLLRAGVNVALGTDGAASNNDLDMLGEMRSAALMAKNVSKDAGALTAFTALKMATLNGAIALGLVDKIGSLVKGKSADITAIDLNALNTQPVYDPVSQLVYAANSQQVSDVWVAGKQVLQNAKLTTLDQEKILAKTREWQYKIQNG